MPIGGSVVEYLDVSWLADGTLTASASLTNAVGNSAVGTKTLIKDTQLPYLSVTGVPAKYLTGSNVSSAYISLQAESSSTVQWTITDGVHILSGSHVINPSGQWNNTGAYFTSMNDGPVTATVTATDVEGNPNTIVYNLIKETVAPGGSFSIAGTVINTVTATTNPTLALSLAFTAPSGIATVAYSTNGGSTYGATQAYSTSASLLLTADGLYTIAIKATTNAGNVGTYTKQVRLDRVGPAVTSSITAPTNAGSYDTGQSIALTYSAADVDNVASLSAVLDGTTSITSGVAFSTETLGAGTHTIVINAKDGLGNVSTTTITIQVHTTIGGLTKAVNDGATAAKITSSTTSSQLLSYLSSAQAALNANNHASAKTYLASFVSLVSAQSGVTINAAYAALLIGWANDLITRL